MIIFILTTKTGSKRALSLFAFVIFVPRRMYRLRILFISNYINPLISYPIFALVSFFFSRHVAFVPFHFNSLQTQHPIDTINHNRNQDMGLCSSSNIELNPLTDEEVQEEIAAAKLLDVAKQDVAEKLGVAVDEIVSLNIVCTIFLSRM